MKGAVMKSKLDGFEVQHLNAEVAEVFAKGAEEKLCVPRRIPLRTLRLITRLKSLKILACAFLITGCAIKGSAQRKPTEATRPYVVKSSQSLEDLKKELQPDNKTAELIDSGGMQLRVAVQHEKNKTGSAAELHDASDDVYYVLDGTATLVLGGRLEDPKETDPGEWRSPRIIDGKTLEIKKGDLVIVPRGTPHQRSTANQNFTMILIKIYAEPLKKRP